MHKMTLTEISDNRLINQRVYTPDIHSVKDLVTWMGAIQAQDFTMAKWAVGIRMKDSTNETIEAAFNKGEIIRTHLLRPTWHLVSSDDIYWMLELTAPKIKSSLSLRRQRLGLSSEVLSKTNAIIEKALSGGFVLTREELAEKFHDANIKTDENRLSHIMFSAELDGLVCSGPLKGDKLTYALLNERVLLKKNLLRDEALAELAIRYFNSHGPATLKDFTWWSGLSVTESRKALDFVKTEFISESLNSETYWFPNSFSESIDGKSSVYLLPAYDEFLISYANRIASISQVDNPKAISNNGIFRPVIVANGQVVGLWKRSIKKEKVIIGTEFFNPPSDEIKRQIAKAAEKYGLFLGKKSQL